MHRSIRRPPSPWSPAPRAPLTLPALLRELSALLGTYSLADLAGDLAALACPVPMAALDRALRQDQELPQAERVRRYVELTGYRPSECERDPEAELPDDLRRLLAHVRARR